MALEGTLRDFSLADLFQLIAIQRKTGVLTLKNGSEEVTVSFLDGNVVSADSLNKNLEDRLGTVLVRSGRISAQKLQEALKVQQETLQRLGYLLVHNGHIREEDLREALKLQVTQIVYRLFRWQDGDYHFSQEETVEYDKETFTPLSAENILMEGIRMIDEWPILERKIRSFGMVFRKTQPDIELTVIAEKEEDPKTDLDVAFSPGESPLSEQPPGNVLRLAKDEAAVYELIDGARTVQEVIDCSRMAEFETCRVLYDLLSRDLIVEGEAEPTAETDQVQDRPSRLGPVLEVVGYVLVSGAVLLSLGTMKHSPVSGMPQDLVPSGAVERMRELVARNRIERIDEAIQVFYLQKGFYPDDLEAIVKGRLVSDTTLRDPWGRGYGYVSTTDGYRIIAYGPGGVENPDRSITRDLPRLTEEKTLPPAERTARTLGIPTGD